MTEVDAMVLAIIPKDLMDLHARAVKEVLWFYSSYQDLWFSPAEMLNSWKQKKFLWSAQNGWNQHVVGIFLVGQRVPAVQPYQIGQSPSITKPDSSVLKNEHQRSSR